MTDTDINILPFHIPSPRDDCDHSEQDADSFHHVCLICGVEWYEL